MLGLSGIGVELGRQAASLTERSPSRIAAGFGGTLNLVISTFLSSWSYMLTTLPSHVYLAGEFAFLQIAVRSWLVAGSLASLVIGILAVFLPMWIGIRTFRRQEFH